MYGKNNLLKLTVQCDIIIYTGIFMCHIIKLNKKNKFGNRTMKLVDNGTWGLFVGLSDKDVKIKYALNTGDEYYFLDKDGGVISVDRSLINFKCQDIARFSEINVCHIYE